MQKRKNFNNSWENDIIGIYITATNHALFSPWVVTWPEIYF